MKAIFSQMKNTLFCTQLSPQKTGNWIFRALKFLNFLVEHALRPPSKKGSNGYGWLLYSNLLATLLLLLKLLCLLWFNFILGLNFISLCFGVMVKYGNEFKTKGSKT